MNNKDMHEVSIILTGFGNVGKAFVDLVQKKAEVCRTKYGVSLSLAAVFRSQKALVFSPALALKDNPEGLNIISGDEGIPGWKEDRRLADVIENYAPGVLVECTPTESYTGGAGLDYIRLALDKGWHVVTANKGPLVVDFFGLMERARLKDRCLKISGATAAALPTLDVALYALAGTEIVRMEGILNGTANYILTRIGEGSDYLTALSEAQKKGITETDPAKDVQGWDTAFKVLLLTNAIFDLSFSLQDVKVEGISEIDPGFIRDCREKGEKLKLLGRMEKKEDRFILEVKLLSLDGSHPLYNVDNTEKGITFETDTMSSVTVIGGKSDPQGTAAALLKDIINIYRYL
jgi:homoserine dehydrogenase